MKTDKWYKDQPEWGTDESKKKAKSMTPGQIDEEDYDRKRDIDAERGIPRKKVMSFKTHSNMSPEDKAKRKADYKKAMAASLANIKKQFEETGKDSKGHFRATEKGAGMTAKGVAAYNRKTGGNLKTAVTGKVKPGSKAANRRKSYCARSAGQMKQFPKAAKDPNSRLRQARKRWKC